MPGYIQGANFHRDVIDLVLDLDPKDLNLRGDLITKTIMLSPESKKELQKIYDKFFNEHF